MWICTFAASDAAGAVAARVHPALTPAALSHWVAGSSIFALYEVFHYFTHVTVQFIYTPNQHEYWESFGYIRHFFLDKIFLTPDDEVMGLLTLRGVCMVLRTVSFDVQPLCKSSTFKPPKKNLK